MAPLREALQHEGQWLFRWRSYLPLVLFLIVVPSMVHFTYPKGSHTWDEAWEMICLAISALGLAIRCHVVGTTPSGTSGRNTHGQVAKVLNTTGWYSVVRHPLYVGNYLMWLGIALFPRLWWLAVLVTMAFWLYYERIMFAEEEFLRQQFGPAFETWAARTPAFIPNFRQWVAPSLPFSWRMVLRREYSGLYAMILSFSLLELVGNIVMFKSPTLDPLWTVIFAATTVVYLTLLTLKRKTRILAISGR